MSLGYRYTFISGNYDAEYTARKKEMASDYVAARAICEKRKEIETFTLLWISGCLNIFLC
ncbi:hypothetical protein K440DRAFT_632206 [Wilcoxina mikolae CBS 423.85]|nr:hypothetical protein K440DRAFT_632206 [Wilcoxina mikolae CBS 423.85]